MKYQTLVYLHDSEFLNVDFMHVACVLANLHTQRHSKSTCQATRIHMCAVCAMQLLLVKDI